MSINTFRVRLQRHQWNSRNRFFHEFLNWPKLPSRPPSRAESEITREQAAAISDLASNHCGKALGHLRKIREISSREGLFDFGLESISPFSRELEVRTLMHSLAFDKAKSLMLKNPVQEILGKDTVASLERELLEHRNDTDRQSIQLILSAGKARGVSEILSQSEISQIADSLTLKLFFLGNGVENPRETASKLAKTYFPPRPASNPSLGGVMHLREHSLRVRNSQGTGMPVAHATPFQTQIAWAAAAEEHGCLQAAISLLERAKTTAGDSGRLQDLSSKITSLARLLLLQRIGEGQFEEAEALFSRYGKPQQAGTEAVQEKINVPMR